MNLTDLIKLDARRTRGHVVCVIGGGGKSTLIHKLSAQLAEQGVKTVITTTTKIQRMPNVDVLLEDESPDLSIELETVLKDRKLAQVAKGTYKDGDRLVSISPNGFKYVRRLAEVILIEADGARQRPLKTHKDYEPVIPTKSATVIVVCGADIVGRRLSDRNVHRASLFAKKWSLKQGEVLTPEIIANELLSPHGYLRNIPLRADVIYLINRCDKNEVGGRLLADKIATRSGYTVFLGSLKKEKLSLISRNHTHA